MENVENVENVETVSEFDKMMTRDLVTQQKTTLIQGDCIDVMKKLKTILLI